MSNRDRIKISLNGFNPLLGVLSQNTSVYRLFIDYLSIFWAKTIKSAKICRNRVEKCHFRVSETKSSSEGSNLSKSCRKVVFLTNPGWRVKKCRKMTLFLTKNLLVNRPGRAREGLHFGTPKSDVF